MANALNVDQFIMSGFTMRAAFLAAETSAMVLLTAYTDERKHVGFARADGVPQRDKRQ